MQEISLGSGLSLDSGTGVLSATGSGSGTVNSGLANYLAYYPSNGTTVDDLTVGADLTVSSTTLISPNWVNVKDHGAVGDGVTNDTAAITAAIATGKDVYIPIGTFLVTGTAGATPIFTLAANQSIFS